jgi:hypothetical protein
MLSKALAWVSVSIWAPILGNMEGRCFHRALEIKRYVNVSSPEGPVRDPEEFSLALTF